MAVLEREAEDMGVAMWEFWGARLRTWGLLCGSFAPGGRGYGGCYVAVLGREVEDMGVVMWQFWGGRLRIWGLLCGSLGPGG